MRIDFQRLLELTKHFVTHSSSQSVRSLFFEDNRLVRLSSNCQLIAFLFVVVLFIGIQ